ncbi:hypothetical protein N9C82_01935 [bacterium]|nr:hypothetical protein [bacterium]
MSTNHTSTTLLSRSERHKQGISTFSKFQKRPKHLLPKIEEDTPLSPQPLTAPRNRIYLFSAEWAWSPINNRLNYYFLTPTQTGWQLWNNYTEDGHLPWSWHWQLLAYGNRCRANEKTIGTHLLLEFWKWEAEYYSLEHYDKVIRSGLLSIADVNAIAGKVWKNG